MIQVSAFLLPLSPMILDPSGVAFLMPFFVDKNVATSIQNEAVAERLSVGCKLIVRRAVLNKISTEIRDSVYRFLL